MMLELVCYGAIIALVVPLTIRMSVQLLHQLDMRATALTHAIMEENALCAIERDIARAPCNSNTWKKIKEHHIAWYTTDGIMGWRVRKGALLFYTRRTATNKRHVQRVIPLPEPIQFSGLIEQQRVRAIDITRAHHTQRRIWLTPTEYVL